ncbi:hypothetical protein WR25_06023 [Diploscapter pachys]|uniref:Uncharacterized protein n=1 Tax=Diploscapter pachys TaxID=2018661 RepID=A0A2A2LQP5_9BILA|nr:hypothetical protein WR25_06023 [Diploscapter pachys]
MGNTESQYQGYIKENHMNAAMAQFAVQIVSQVVPNHKHMNMTNRFGELPTYEWTFDEQDIMDKNRCGI